MEPNKKKLSLDHAIFWPPLIIIAIVCAFIIKNPEQANKISGSALSWVTNNLGWAFEWYVIIMFAICMYFVFGKLKDKRLGDGPPEFSTFSWLGMMFTSTSSAALIYWASIEWLYYMQSPPHGAKPYSTEAAMWGSAYGMYHWGLIPVAMYVVVGVAIGYNFFVKKRDVIKPSSVCGVLGKRKEGWLGKVIDVLYIIGMVAGVGTSLGLGTPLVAELISKIFGVKHTLSLDGSILIAWIALFIITLYFGLQKGIKFLSDLRVWLAFGVIIFVLIFGNMSYILNGFTDAVGMMLQNLIVMTFYTDTFGKSGWPQGWTIFYWAWFLNCVLSYAIYLVKISKGRTIREFALGVLGSITIGEMVFFGVFTPYSMNIYYKGIIDIPAIFAKFGAPHTIVEIWSTLPLAAIVLPVLLVYCFVSTGTFINGVAYTLAMVTTKGITENDEPSRFNRISWALILGLLAISLLLLGGLQPLQTSSVIGGLPMMVVCIIIPISFFREIKKTGWGGIEQDLNANVAMNLKKKKQSV
ncbi:L-carnitine/gamma-butyrobetaine antiporter [Neobacillus sp. OS1-32]|uniref:L-carnitine/gamma-butyrobetaine antiport BCCT transporter n=1 Tax=Neobacillus paridis TaxID=2803862 RepID=A0ABS1TW12_9BACI|nr:MULTISPECIES: L-carnitine/gamma-butyrobetaine antiporter [Neobacillus]MBL4954748.1 L-carnitine/gamma-butyrobetaine antiport BCCT transporter [Neobacillus paridis]WML29835.1 L-carnitine/gamma-butyrobetaine antiporter [Neobacillus sp. OS1-32]